MRRIFLATSAILLLVACNDEQTTSSSTTQDSTATTTITDTAGQQMNSETSAMSGQTMMSIMNSSMENMKGIQSTGNPDNDFAAMMKAHHLGAIEMAQLELAQGTDASVKAMAQKMLDEQQKEVAELNTFLSGHQAHGGGEAFFKEAMAITNNMKMDMDHNGSVDKQFVEMMIPHHQSAIDMAKAYIKAGAHEEKLKVMANNVISSQQKEIAELKAWLDKNK